MNFSKLCFLTAAVCVAVSSCGALPGGGGGGVNESDAGTVVPFTFNKGFTFVRKDDRKVYLADQSDLQTSATLTTTAGVINPSLSANGKQVVFVLKNGSTTQIQTVLTTGGTPATLVSSDATRKNFHHPVFAPNGSQVAFSYDDGASNSIGLINTDGSGFRKLIGGGALGYSLPSYAPDGRSVVCAAGTVGLQLTQIERVDLMTGLATSITNTLGNEATDIANRLTVSPDGSKAAFDARVSSGVTRIFSIDFSSRAVTKANEYMGEANTNDSYPTWYTATTLAFSSDSGGNDNVYTTSIAGTNRRLLMPKAIEPWYGPIQ